jgi:hypothetical protein
VDELLYPPRQNHTPRLHGFSNETSRFAAVIFLFNAIANGQEAGLATSEHFEFDGQKLYFAFAGRNPGERFKEYIPTGQKLESWTNLASVREYSNANDPLQFAEGLSRVTKQHNPAAQTAIVHNADANVAIIDFVTWPPNLSFVEFNVFRIETSGAGGLIAYQYAVRDYKNPREFMTGLSSLRQRLQMEMITKGLVVVRPQTASNSSMQNR